MAIPSLTGPNKPRRGSFALGTGALGGLTTTLEQIISSAINGGAGPATTWEHTATFLGFGVAIFLLEKAVDWIKARSDGMIDLTDTLNEFRKATADGKIDSGEGKSIAKSLVDDADDAVDKLIDSQGADTVFAALERWQERHPENEAAP